MKLTTEVKGHTVTVEVRGTDILINDHTVATTGELAAFAAGFEQGITKERRRIATGIRPIGNHADNDTRKALAELRIYRPPT